jgi:hypothetical protein
MSFGRPANRGMTIQQPQSSKYAVQQKTNRSSEMRDYKPIIGSRGHSTGAYGYE